jgi:glycosyltransferase involved in cell wall biosynthesis
MANGGPIRVLHVLDGLDRGGIETWLVRVLRHIDRDRFPTDVLVTGPRPGAYTDEARALGVVVIPCLNVPVERMFRPLRPLWLFHYARSLGRILRERGPYAIVHSHFDPCGLPLRCAHRAGVPVRIAHSHDSSPELGYRGRLVRRCFLPLARRWIVAHATLGLGVSRRAAAARFGPHWDQDARWRTFPCGIDLRPFAQAVNRQAVRRELGLPDDAFVVGHVGRFHQDKNHSLLIDVAAELARRMPRFRLVLVGDGPLRAAITHKVAGAGLADRVHFLGVRADVPRLMLGAFDVFALPSRCEGLGLVLVEAQAAGLPCVISDAVPDEAVAVPPLVCRVPAGAPAAAWVDAVLVFADSPPPVSRADAFARIGASPLNIDNNAAALERLYLECLGADRFPQARAEACR